MALPYPAIGGLYWDTTDATKILKAGDVQAAVGDTITKWVSADGTKTMDAVGTPILRQRSWQPHPTIELNGSSGFAMTDSTLDGETSGTFVCGYRRTSAADSLTHTLGAISSTNSTGTRVQWFTTQIAAGRGQGIAGMKIGGATTDIYTGNDFFGRKGAFSRLSWTSKDTEYKVKTSFGGAPLTGTNNGYWVDTFPSFPRASLTLGFLRNTTDNSFATGDLSYAGWFSENTDNDVARLETYLANLYPTRSCLLIGDSRFNTDSFFQLFEQEVNGLSLQEIASGGDTLAAALTAWQTQKAFGGSTYAIDDAVLLIGVNDSINGTAASASHIALRALLDDIEASGQVTRVHLLNETPVSGNASATAGEVDEHRAYSCAIEGEARRRDHRLVDSYKFMEDPDTADAINSAWSADALHPNATGDEKLSGLVGHSLRNSDTALQADFATVATKVNALEVLLRITASGVAGSAAVTDNGDGTHTISFKDTDGSTEVANTTYTFATGARTRNS